MTENNRKHGKSKLVIAHKLTHLQRQRNQFHAALGFFQSKADELLIREGRGCHYQSFDAVSDLGFSSNARNRIASDSKIHRWALFLWKGLDRRRGICLKREIITGTRLCFVANPVPYTWRLSDNLDCLDCRIRFGLSKEFNKIPVFLEEFY